MNKTLFPACCLSLVVLACGCVSLPPAENANASAYSVGDRARIMFDEIVVSLPLQGANAPYQNLHILPAAVVNVRQTTYSSTYEAQDIVRRLEPRVAARLTEVLSSLGEQSLSNTDAVRRKALAEAQTVVDAALRQWKHGSDYRVEIVIAGSYWTDASVGRPQQQRGSWW